MASYEKVPSSELEAGLTMDREISSVDEKAQMEESAGSQDSSRPRNVSPLRRFIVVLFLFVFIGFTFLRGVALVSVLSVHCMSAKYSELGNQTELIEDDAFLQALRSTAPDEFCRLYGEGCPEANEQETDNWEIAVVAEDGAVDLSDSEPAIKASLDKRQDSGNSNATSVAPPTSDAATTSSNQAPETTSSSPPSTSSDDDVETSSQAPSNEPPTTTSQAPPPPTSTPEDETTSEPPTSRQPSSEPATTSEQEPTSSSTSERPASSSGDEEPTSTPGSSSSRRRTITTGSITTSSAEVQVYTTTLEDGGPTVITSTSWVEFVPVPTAQSEDDPDLQGSASGWQRNTVLQVAMGLLVGGILLV